MPLTRDTSLTLILKEYSDIIFTMLDGDKRVACRVGLSYLASQIEAHKGASVEDVFRRHRSSIEALASAQYDAGHPEPRITGFEVSR
jgi:Protein of unknown function (DUF1488)